MNRRELANELARGTELVVEAAAGRLEIRDFVARYDSFYHRNALDGHEANAETKMLLDEFVQACSLHEAVQTEVVDQLYLGDGNRAQYVAAGRLLPEHAGQRLREIAAAHEPTKILHRLRGEEG